MWWLGRRRARGLPSPWRRYALPSPCALVSLSRSGARRGAFGHREWSAGRGFWWGFALLGRIWETWLNRAVQQRTSGADRVRRRMSSDYGPANGPSSEPGELRSSTYLTSLIASKHSKLVTTAASKQAPQRYSTLTRRLDDTAAEGVSFALLRRPAGAVAWMRQLAGLGLLLRDDGSARQDLPSGRRG